MSSAGLSSTAVLDRPVLDVLGVLCDVLYGRARRALWRAQPWLARSAGPCSTGSTAVLDRHVLDVPYSALYGVLYLSLIHI